MSSNPPDRLVTPAMRDRYERLLISQIRLDPARRDAERAYRRRRVWWRRLLTERRLTTAILGSSAALAVVWWLWL